MIDKEKQKRMMEDVFDKRKKAKSEKLTVEAYRDLKAQGLSDAKIIAKYGFHTVSFTKWKRENNLIGKAPFTKPQQVAQQAKGEKMMNDVVEVQKPIEVDYKAKYEDMKRKCDLTYEELKNRNFYISELQQQLTDAKAQLDREYEMSAKRGQEQEKRIQELEESLVQSNHVSEFTEVQQEIWKLAQENERLKKYEADYRNLEVDYRNLHSKNRALEEELELYRNDDMMFRLLSKKYNAVRDRLDEVLA